jgi:allantoinase
LRPDEIYQAGNAVVMPGLVDTHVHVNEPGRTDWEGFTTATQACAAGGVTTVVDMPLNCLPVTTSAENLKCKLSVLDHKLWVDVAFWGGATSSSMNDLEELLKAGVVGVKSFMIDSGIPEFPPVSAQNMRQAMELLRRYHLPYILHAELDLGAAKDGNGRQYQDFLESRPDAWEFEAIKLAIELARETKCHVHIVHLSSAKALSLISDAKKSGVKLTVETCPHYLMLQSEDVADGDTLYKCCPPIRNHSNRQALWRAVLDGTIDMIVSDHSPCTAALKRLDTGNFAQAWGGISSLQLTLPLIWTGLKQHGGKVEDLWRLMALAPASLIAQAHRKGDLAPGMQADIVVWQPEQEFIVDGQKILVKNKIGPYHNKQLSGVVETTFLAGKIIFQQGKVIEQSCGQTILRGN